MTIGSNVCGNGFFCAAYGLFFVNNNNNINNNNNNNNNNDNNIHVPMPRKQTENNGSSKAWNNSLLKHEVFR